MKTLKSSVKVIHHERQPGFYNKFIKPFFFIRKYIKVLNPDIVHAHLQLSDLYVAFYKKLSRNRIKIVRTVHNSRGLTKFPTIVDRFLFNAFDENVACSEYVKNNYVNKEISRDMVAIPNGIDLTLLDNISDNKSELRKQLKLPLDIPIFLNIGRMNPNGPDNVSLKNQNLIIEALHQLPMKNGYLMLFIGDGTLKGEFEKRCKDYNLDNVVKFTGSVVSPYEYIKAADFCLMPSLNEGLPIALIEAVCAGLYSVTSNIPAFDPFQSDSVHTLKDFDVEKFSDYVMEMVSNKDEFIAKGKNNMDYFRKKFSITSVANHYLDIYI